MLLTVSLLNKGSFLGSLINKCRQVVRIKPVNQLETNIKPNISTSITSTTSIPTITVLTGDQQSDRPAAVANLSLSSPSHVAKTLEEKAGLPPKPKKPLTPYFRFMKEQRPKIQAANPKLSIVDVVRKVSKEWVTADSTLKQRLQEEYKKEQQKYVEARTKYDAKITDEQRSQLKELKQEQIDAKERRMMRKRIKELGRPKKPASAFLRFIAKERILTPQTSNQTFREWHQKATAKWGTLTDEQKNVYIMESRKELEKYKVEISLWEEKMIRLGHIDVIRHGNLIDPPEPKPKKH
ncbi:transcription factor A, mitochondrial isoform X1 [Lucilia sericata]|uniref:transcription factor A, mitochondrial isoform X1 n=1 Tax=Lucilia sericata TaxID=13632 RepID=UPI0018A80DC2|nr:transcription factor A, mitochondrial isoform X1 [Lucilia sericata]XP_037810236.1 transcription factor A, mitochondrial isoform X1 [Lucilia sericata]